MGILSRLVQGLRRGADRMSEFTSKRGSRTHNKGRGLGPPGWHSPAGSLLRCQRGSAPALTAQSLFSDVVAPHITKDFKEGTFSRDQLETYGFEPTQEGKLFKLYPKNYVS